MQLSRTHANDQTNVNSSSFSQVNKNKHASNDESFERITRAHLSRQIDVARPTLRGSEGWILSDKNNVIICIFSFVRISSSFHLIFQVFYLLLNMMFTNRRTISFMTSQWHSSTETDDWSGQHRDRPVLWVPPQIYHRCLDVNHADHCVASPHQEAHQHQTRLLVVLIVVVVVVVELSTTYISKCVHLSITSVSLYLLLASYKPRIVRQNETEQSRVGRFCYV